MKSAYSLQQILQPQYYCPIDSLRETRTGQGGHILRCAVGCCGSVRVATCPCRCAIDRLSRKPQQASHRLSNRNAAAESLTRLDGQLQLLGAQPRITPEHEPHFATNSVFFIFPYTFYIHFWPSCHFNFGQLRLGWGLFAYWTDTLHEVGPTRMSKWK